MVGDESIFRAYSVLDIFYYFYDLRSGQEGKRECLKGEGWGFNHPGIILHHVY